MFTLLGKQPRLKGQYCSILRKILLLSSVFVLIAFLFYIHYMWLWGLDYIEVHLQSRELT